MGPLRYIFFAFVLAFWVICGLGVANGQWTGIHWVMLGLAHLGCAIIFANFVYVFTYGYAVSMVIVNLGVMAWRPVPTVLLVAGLGLAYGLRLLWFVHTRYRSPSYRGNRERADKANANVPLPLRLFMWISCGWLMAFVAMPAWVVAATGGLTPGILAGAGVMLAGLLLEAVADQQKQAAKMLNPCGLVTGGLYARLRHPNYLGEIVFQIGLITVAVVAAPGGWALVAGVVGPLYIAVLMYYAAHDQDHQQNQRHGTDPAYQAWRSQTSCLLPGL